MSRPTARKSTLGARHPAAPAAPARLVEEQRPATASRQQPTKKASRTALTVYVDPEVASQARAFLHQVPAAKSGYSSLSDFVSSALERAVVDAQATYNEGEAWPPAAAGVLPSGRRQGS
ncbi:hypothetical protein ACI3EY_16885 [Ornithinimicrobium sp. LYQ92]|uniref:hypothetical protein n=1 Tax=Serinicoccus sp. LYQ92 TaxID=3378798 RepID=UPI0038519444